MAPLFGAIAAVAMNGGLYHNAGDLLFTSEAIWKEANLQAKRRGPLVLTQVTTSGEIAIRIELFRSR